MSHSLSQDANATVPMAELLNKLYPSAEPAATVVADAGDGLQGSTCDRHESRSIYVHCDVASASGTENAVAATVRQYGRLDIMVNNAGIAAEATSPSLVSPYVDRSEREEGYAPKPEKEAGGISARVHESPEWNWDKMMAVNAKGVWLGCKYAIAQMLKQSPLEDEDGQNSEDQRGFKRARGWTINMSSIAGLVGMPGSSAYCASKGAVLQLTKAIALEYARDRIHVNCINPGFVDTGLLAGVIRSGEQDPQTMYQMIENWHPWSRIGTAEDVARTAIFLAEEGWVSGHALVVDGAYVAQ